MAEKRRRLDAAAARELILDAAEKRLIVVGPSGIRLQEVAADAGVSHPTVLHHFGSRQLLVKAVISRSLAAINKALIEAIEASRGDEEQLEAMMNNVALALERTGHARVIMWLALEGHRIDGADVQLSDVVDATHALRLSRAKGSGDVESSAGVGGRAPGERHPTRDDTAKTVVLAALALVGGAVIGSTMLENAGLGSDAATGIEFRRWLARLLLTHLDQ